MRHLSLLVLPLLVSGALATAQPTQPGAGGAIGIDDALLGAEGNPVEAGRVTRRMRHLVRDGSLSAEDAIASVRAAGNRVSPSEMDELRVILSGRLPGSSATFTIDKAAREAAAKAILLANLSDEGRATLSQGKTFSGGKLPDSVRDVLVRAKLNGAITYDYTETNSDGEGLYSDYPAITPATENMTFAYTEVSPATLAADIADVNTSLWLDGVRTLGSGGKVANYKPGYGGTGSIAAAYDEAFHPVTGGGNPTSWRTLLSTLSYPDWLAADYSVDDVRKARTRSGNKWSSNCAILADGTIHCLPAIRRHSATPRLILTNPALARGRRVVWNGHLRITRGKVTYIGTSGRISKRAARGRDRFVNPIPLLKAWGFEMAENLVVRSEHSTARYEADEARAVLRAPSD